MIILLDTFPKEIIRDYAKIFKYVRSGNLKSQKFTAGNCLYKYATVTQLLKWPMGIWSGGNTQPCHTQGRRQHTTGYLVNKMLKNPCVCTCVQDRPQLSIHSGAMTNLNVYSLKSSIFSKFSLLQNFPYWLFCSVSMRHQRSQSARSRRKKKTETQMMSGEEREAGHTGKDQTVPTVLPWELLSLCPLSRQQPSNLQGEAASPQRRGEPVQVVIPATLSWVENKGLLGKTLVSWHSKPFFHYTSFKRDFTNV